MKLTKDRARAPLIEDGSFLASRGFDGAKQESTFTLTCHGPWVQGKGHTSGYTMHLTKLEMLWTVKEWLAGLQEDERQAEQRRKALLPSK